MNNSHTLLLHEEPIALPVRDTGIFQNHTVAFLWLGQSGFLFSWEGKLIAFDPYLSNYLEAHHGTLPYPHHRMMDPPVQGPLLNDIDMVVISHGHEDHFDPDLVKDLMEHNQKVIFVMPAGCTQVAKDYGIDKSRIRLIETGNPMRIFTGMVIEGFAAAHPRPDFNNTTVSALSYSITMGDFSFLFAGDTTVYKEWIHWVISHQFDLLILPVNGRNPEKERNGIVGNMDIKEATLCSLLTQTPLLGTHFGMFSWNTIDIEETESFIDQFALTDWVTLTHSGILYTITP